MMRMRGLGNSATQMQNKLEEQHRQAYLSKTCHYLTDCEYVLKASESGLVSSRSFQDPPTALSVPKYRWLQTVYCNDVMRRIDEVKASITSTFGRVLKMDSTKKVVKKLAGRGAGTAAWVTNIGNEHGQVLMSVLTSGEGQGLGPMVSGIIERYSISAVSPPEVLYVDRGCCRDNQLRNMFGAWPRLIIRLDVWHFMRRFSSGCTTDAHPLYGVFMSRLSSCLFQWSREDLQLLKEAKRSELLALHIDDPSDTDVIHRLTKKELSLHCRRTTRGTEETTRLIGDLLEAFSGDQGLDTMGTPLFNKEQIWNLWESQKQHVACLQDPEGIELYTQTRTLLKGQVRLPVFRCARGSTSLESFHLHLARFIPGTSASDMHFHAYLLEGLVRWNEDRAAAALDLAGPKIYSSLLRHAIRVMSTSVLKKDLVPEYQHPGKYTGELIGVEYLYSQTGETLQDFTLDPDSKEAAQFEPAEDTDEEVDEGFVDTELEEDPTVPPAEPESLPVIPAAKTVSTPAPAKPAAAAKTVSTPAPAKPAAAAKTVSTPAPAKPAAAAKTVSTPAPAKPAAAAKTVSTPAPVPALTPAPEIPMPDQQEDLDPEESVGPDNVEGYARVEALARYLFSLRDQSMALTNSQADHVIRLWRDLVPYDKRAATLSPRAKPTLTTGRFKARKGSASTTVPGVDSTKRCFLGADSGPAQWPNANRYMEILITKLCGAYPAPEKSKEKTITRWSLVGRAYKNIAETVRNNARVMADTRIQLLDINQKTLGEWFNKRCKAQERQQLEQGITLQLPSAAASMPLPAAKPLLAAAKTLSTVQMAPHSEQFEFILPKNTAGQATTVRRRLLPPPSATPSNPYYISTPEGFIPAAPYSSPDPFSSSDSSSQYILNSSQSSSLGPVTLPDKELARSTLWYHKNKRKRALEGETIRTYTRHAAYYTCQLCGKERTSEQHTQYYGKWFCATTATKTLDEWRSTLVEERQQKKERERRDKEEKQMQEHETE